MLQEEVYMTKILEGCQYKVAGPLVHSSQCIARHTDEFECAADNKALQVTSKLKFRKLWLLSVALSYKVMTCEL